MASDAMARAQVAAMLEAWAAAIGTPFIGLFKTAIVPDPLTPLSAFVPPTGSWYAPVAAVYDDASQNPDGSISIRTQAVQFNYTGTDPAEIIYGWYIIDTAATPDAVLQAGLLPVPVTMGSVLDSTFVAPIITIPAIPIS
jgi:hypothetical protein